MKIILSIVFIATLNARAVTVFSQQINLNVNNASLKSVFRDIQKQTDYDILYLSEDLENTKSVTANFTNKSIKEALDILLKGQPISFEIDKKAILIRRENPATKSPVPTQIEDTQVAVQTRGIVGIILDNDGEPLSDVTIRNVRTGYSTSSKDDGSFEIPEVLIDDELAFSLIGYTPQRLVVENYDEQRVVLAQEDQHLDDVVVVGYGTQRKRDLTGAVSQINAENLENENPGSVQELLRANAAGLNVGYSASAKNEGSLQMRGRKSLTAGGEPLIVLDGVIYYGSLSDINPNDIETFDILKDASSAAVFGAKAANGVIMITTKRGKEGKTVINVDANYGMASMSVNQPIYDAQGYISHRENVMKSINENHQPYQFSDPRELPADISLDQWFAYDNSSGDPVDIWLQRLNMKQVEIDNYKEGHTIDWYDRVFQNGRRQDYTVNVSNSTKDVTYFWSLGYQDNEGIIVGDKFSVLRSRLNLESRVTDFLSVGVNAQFSDRDESQVPVAWTQMVNVSPWGSEFKDDGVTLRRSPQDDPAVTANPFLNPVYTNRLQKYNNLTSIIFAKVELPFGINYQMNFTPRFEWYKYLNHQSSDHPTWELQGGMATRTQSDEFTWQLDNIFKWNKTIADIHQFDVTMLINAEKFRSWRNVIDNNNFNPSDQLGYHNIGVGTNPIVSSDDQYSTGDALMGRIFYSLKDRYMLTLSMRRDGYSAFGQANPRATFPAAALGWVFSDENFFSSNWFDYGKLRVSYGVNGNRDIGRYAALSRLATGDYLHIGPDGTVQRVPSLEITNMDNRDLRWEKTAAYNVGLDFSLLNNRISGSIEAYNMSTTDLLVNRALPPVTGFSSVISNLGEVNNKGFEIQLNTVNMRRENFSWNTSVNFSLNRNKIVSLYGDMTDVLDDNGQVVGQRELDDITNGWFIGRDIDEIWDLRVLGVYQEHEREEAARYGVEPGDFKLEDVNQDGNYTDADRQFQGYTTPRFRWTLRNEFSFLKQFTFSFMMYSNWGQRATFNEAKNLGNGYMDRTNSYIIPYWAPENPINDFARLSSSSGSANYNVYREKSFIRLDNIAASYNVPNSLLNRTGLQAMKVVMSLRNVGFYAPEMFLWDPENNGPTPRTFMLGVNLTL